MHDLTPVDPDQVAAYVRWSTDEQSEGTTLAVQVEACRHFVQAQGWRWRGDLLFVDDGYSGGTLQRPALTALRGAVRAGRVSCVVVFKLDRLSRSVMDTANLVLDEWGGLCHVRSTREAIDTADPAGRMFFYLLASYAEWERSVIRERTLAGRIQRARAGRVVHVRPYGYRPGPTPGSCEIALTEAVVVRRIFREYREGLGYYRIAARLNADGIRPRHARRWHGQSVRQILTNPIYGGIVAFGRSTAAPQLRTRAGRRRIYFDAPRYALVQGAVPAILDPADWEAVQRLRQDRRPQHGRHARAGEYLLSGIARCRCGAVLVGDRRVRREHTYRYYRCSARGTGSCPGHLLPADPVEAAVILRLRPWFASLQERALFTALQARMHETRRETTKECSALSARQTALRARRRRLDDDYDRGEIPAAVYSRRLSELASEECQLSARVRTLRARLAGPAHAAVGADSATHLAAVVRRVDGWTLLPPPQRREFLRHILADLRIWRHDGEPGSPCPAAGAVGSTLHIDLAVRHAAATDPCDPTAPTDVAAAPQRRCAHPTPPVGSDATPARNHRP